MCAQAGTQVHTITYAETHTNTYSLVCRLAYTLSRAQTHGLV